MMAYCFIFSILKINTLHVISGDIQMSDSRGRIVGTKLNLLEQLSLNAWKFLTSLSLNAHKHQKYSLFFFLWYKAWVQKETKKITHLLHFTPLTNSFTLLSSRKLLNLTSQRVKKYLHHFSFLSEICTAFKNCISSGLDN
jgi:hypothetical protein